MDNPRQNRSNIKSGFSRHLLEALCLLIRLTMIPWFLREIYAKHRVTIINYHNPAPQVFKKHLCFFSRHYTIISIDQLAEALLSDWKQLPPKPLVITFDDGHSGNTDLFDILKKYQVPSVLYAVAGVINTSRRFWFHAIPNTSSAIGELESVDDKTRRHLLEEKYGHTDTHEYAKPEALTSKEIRVFLDSGGTVGSHTLFHPLLTRCARKTAIYELTESKSLLEQLFGGTIRHFAYPGGKWNDMVKKWCQDTGYVTARTTDAGWVTPKTDPFTLPNFGIDDDAGLNKAVVQASGLWDVLRNLPVVSRQQPR